MVFLSWGLTSHRACTERPGRRRRLGSGSTMCRPRTRCAPGLPTARLTPTRTCSPNEYVCRSDVREHRHNDQGLRIAELRAVDAGALRPARSISISPNRRMSTLPVPPRGTSSSEASSSHTVGYLEGAQQVAGRRMKPLGGQRASADTPRRRPPVHPRRPAHWSPRRCRRHAILRSTPSTSLG